LTHSKAAPEAATDPLNHGGGFIPETQQRGNSLSLNDVAIMIWVYLWIVVNLWIDTPASINVEKAETATKKRTKIPTIYYAS